MAREKNATVKFVFLDSSVSKSAGTSNQRSRVQIPVQSHFLRSPEIGLNMCPIRLPTTNLALNYRSALYLKRGLMTLTGVGDVRRKEGFPHRPNCSAQR